MEVNVTDKRNFVKFKNIPRGELFMYKGGIYLKITTIKYYTTGKSLPVEGNVIHLRSGLIYFIDNNTDCELVKATLRIKK